LRHIILTGLTDEHILGANTINECLHFLYTSCSPITALLENMEAILTEACLRRDNNPNSANEAIDPL
jgi:hypothetical protein